LGIEATGMNARIEHDPLDIVSTENLERGASWILICCEGYRCQRQKERLIASIIVIAVALPKTAAKNMSS
jgi:hypothetical protein